ncbi:MAG: hypothetical protein U0835_09920 [Isosphaeraceae bacterium]
MSVGASGHRAGWLALGALMTAYAAVFFVFYPPISGVEDEIGFLNQTRVWMLGAVSTEGAELPYPLHDFIETNGRHVPARHPGRSLAALPFWAAGGGRAVFASGLALHLLMTAAGGATLARLGRSPLWAVLLLFHPTLAVYSRTVMADGPAGGALLLAALAVVCDAPIAAGLAVGLAAAMRYHSALALPLVAATFIYPHEGAAEDRGRRWKRAGLCLLAGAFAGSVLVAYNLAVYHAPNEPFTARRGKFDAENFLPHVGFYALSLMAIWPGMLLAPVLDRSRLRWLTRGVIVVFLGPLLFYYFHDRAPGLLETLILGQRLIQVALPLWVVSYAGVLDDWLARPVRNRIGGVVWGALVTIVCLGLLGANAFASSRHQAHLKALAETRDALLAAVPEGSLIVHNGPAFKVSLRPDGVQAYHVVPLESAGLPVYDPTKFLSGLDAEPRPWFLVCLKKSFDEAMTTYFQEVVARYRMKPVPTRSPLLTVYRTP